MTMNNYYSVNINFDYDGRPTFQYLKDGKPIPRKVFINEFEPSTDSDQPSIFWGEPST